MICPFFMQADQLIAHNLTVLIEQDLSQCNSHRGDRHLSTRAPEKNDSADQRR